VAPAWRVHRLTVVRIVVIQASERLLLAFDDKVAMGDARFRGKPVGKCRREAMARRPMSTSRFSTCASSGPCSRPPARARRLSAWHCSDAQASARAIAFTRLRMAGVDGDHCCLADWPA
jgi:hypothetical protein